MLRTAWDYTQSYLHCCGTVSLSDWYVNMYITSDLHILTFTVRRKEAEQTVPVSCEVSSNITSIASGTAEAESMYQTGCLEMLAKLLGGHLTAV